MAALYALGLLAWHGLRFTPVGSWWPFELVDVFGVMFYLPLPLLLVVGLLARTRAGVLWLGAAALLFAWEYSALFLPRWAPPAFADGTVLRVMTTNVLVMNARTAGILATIAAEQPDVVAIQELDHAQAEYLRTRLADRYPYQVLEPDGDPFGLGFLSRYPLRRDAPDDPAPNACACQRLRVEVGRHEVAFLNVHPPRPALDLARLGRFPVPSGFSSHRTEASLRRAFGLLDGVGGPRVVLGDFNVGDRQPYYRTMTRGLVDAHRAAGWGFGLTFPSPGGPEAPPLALVRIDYVLHDAAVTALGARTGIMPGSDHRYVVADLQLP